MSPSSEINKISQLVLHLVPLKDELLSNTSIHLIREQYVSFHHYSDTIVARTKDNFTFKCHRSMVQRSGQTQDIYAVSTSHDPIVYSLRQYRLMT